MSARLALLAAVTADLVAVPVAGVSAHTGTLPASVDLRAVVGVTLGLGDTDAQSATVDAKTIDARDVVLTARAYASGPAALSRVRAAIDAVAARMAAVRTVPGYTVGRARVVLALSLPAGEPGSDGAGELASVRFTLVPA